MEGEADFNVISAKPVTELNELKDNKPSESSPLLRAGSGIRTMSPKLLGKCPVVEILIEG